MRTFYGILRLHLAGLSGNLVSPRPERAKSYEVGAKADFGRKLHIDVAVFQLDYRTT